MYCEKYNCTMSANTCIARQKNTEKAGWKAGAAGADPGCKDCEQGKKIMEDHLAGKIEEESPDLNHAKTSIDTPPPEEITHTCRIEGCGHTGPLDDFPKNKASKDGHTSECKKCQSKRSSENAKKRREKIKAEITAKVLKEQAEGSDLKVDDLVESKERAFIEITEQGRKLIEAMELREDKILMLDFSDHPGIFDEIIQKAKDEIRSPEAQILYILKTSNCL